MMGKSQVIWTASRKGNSLQTFVVVTYESVCLHVVHIPERASTHT